MTLQQFHNKLRESVPKTFETAAPKGELRYVCWHRINRSSLFGNDRNQVDFPRIQIDIITNIEDDTIVDDVCAALWMMDLTYSVESEGYDDEYNAFRTILQLVVA